MIIIKCIFWVSLLFIFYIYVGYPLTVWCLFFFRRMEVKKAHWEPSVSIIIAAYNEREHIGATIENKLSLNYPREKLEIIVVSDGSDDGTDEIVEQYTGGRVRLIRQEPRGGKTAALNRAVPCATGDILVFSDANSLYDVRAVSMLVRNFSDPQVGYVTGKMIYTDVDGTIIGDGCNTYMKYENFLREMETRIGSVVGVDGGIDAVRKELYRPMNPDQLPDFVLPLKVVEQGYRVVYEPEALLREDSLKTTSDEYRMRVRVSLRALWALHDMRQLLSISEYGTFAWQLWSHKVLRYLCFVFLGAAYFANAALWNDSAFYRWLFTFQNLAYALPFFLQAFIWDTFLGSRVMKMLHFFIIINTAAAHAFIKYSIGHKQLLWTPRKG